MDSSLPYISIDSDSITLTNLKQFESISYDKEDKDLIDRLSSFFITPSVLAKH